MATGHEEQCYEINISTYFRVCKERSNVDARVAEGHRISGLTAGRWFQDRRFRYRNVGGAIVERLNVPLWEHQSSALWACSVPLRNTRPREHDASPNPRFLASWPLRSLAYNLNKTAIIAPEGAEALICFFLTRGTILP